MIKVGLFIFAAFHDESKISSKQAGVYERLGNFVLMALMRGERRIVALQYTVCDSSIVGP